MMMVVVKNTVLSQSFVLLLDVINSTITQFNKSDRHAVSFIERLEGRPDGITADSVKRLIDLINIVENSRGTMMRMMVPLM